MGSTDVNGYCSFSKAIEHLGDRWSLPISEVAADEGNHQRAAACDAGESIVDPRYAAAGVVA